MLYIICVQLRFFHFLISVPAFSLPPVLNTLCTLLNYVFFISQPNFEALTRRGCERKDPWLLAARYRVCQTPIHLRRPKSTPVGRVRRRRPVSRAGSEGGESSVTHVTASSDVTQDASRDLPEDYDFDGSVFFVIV